VDSHLAANDRPRTVWRQDYDLRAGSLAALFGVAVVYLVWQASLTGSTANDRLYGFAGILLGLFICARPATNAIDVLIYERQSWRRVMKGTRGFAWLCLNALVMLAGCVTVIVAVMRATGHGSL
jgi:hypothetical protein